MRLPWLVPMIVVVLLTAGSARSSEGASAASNATSGGTLNLSFATNNLDYVDPALAYTIEGWSLLHATCAQLMSYPDKPAPAGTRLVPEVATGAPRISSGGRTYTFTLRTGFRFSDGTPVGASAFARAINRALVLGPSSPGLPYLQDIVGADAVVKGTSSSASGVVASGNRLVVRFTRPVLDFAAQTTMPFFCAVPPSLPSDPEGLGTFPGSGPYTISEFVRGQRVVLERNTFYRGTRPHRIDRFIVDLQGGTFHDVLDQVEAGRADWGPMPGNFVLDAARGLPGKYGVNKAQLFVEPGFERRSYFLNLSRPLFRNNVDLRRAVSFAIDRAAIIRQLGGPLAARPSDQYLPSTMPGFRDERIYRLEGPDVARARALARGNTRAGKLSLWTFDVPIPLAIAQIIKKNLKAIGLEVEVKGVPPQALFREMARPGAAYDMALGGWVPDYIDPFQYINPAMDGRYVGGANLSWFDSPRYNTSMRRAAGLQGEARYRAYGELDVQLAREAVPIVPIAFGNNIVFVSKRVGCVVLRPGLGLNLAATCLK
jgi:peptide/nickel transport system substrate-binding protein